jgi:asparagine synthase (glutamine-hydrolysing)
MTQTLLHRGPDDSGVWVDASAGLALGHRRLAILDLSPLGHQPMTSACGRYVVSFNGELYNYRMLRRELEEAGHAFRGRSDTEVLLSAVAQWGLESAVSRFNGMFAIALWDRHARLLHLVRDRMGEKPLYYGWMGHTFLCASELKALKAHPRFDSPLHRGALALYLRHNYIPAPYSVYAHVSKVAPGTIVTVALEQPGVTRIAPYWSVVGVAARGGAHPFQGDAAEAAGCLEALLRDAVSLRMEADVPLGAFLSGGVDSSTIAAVMQAQSVKPVRTFSVGFDEDRYNEAPHAKRVAEHLGTAHTELRVSAADALNVIPKMPAVYDEPFSDSSQIPTYLIAALTRQHVTVALSGDGADELFGGYDRYLQTVRLWKAIQAMPGPVRQLTRRVLAHGHEGAWFERFLPRRLSGGRVTKLTDMLAAESLEALYRIAVSHWNEPPLVANGLTEPVTALTMPPGAGQDSVGRLMLLDMMTYLPDDILVKVDRASMAVSLEVRVPYLDHRAVEFAWSLPQSMKLREGRGKWLLRQVLQRYLPASLQDRPKMGFGIPLDSWLRGPLREWAESLLDRKRLLDQHVFDPEPVRQKWAEHLAGTADWQFYLWDVLMCQGWLEEERRTPDGNAC